MDEMRRQALGEQAALVERFAHEPEVEALEVAEAAVDELARAAGGAGGPVAGLEDPHRQATGHGVKAGSCADHPAPPQ